MKSSSPALASTLGMIISGSLTDGFAMRLSSHTKLESIKAGKFVCIQTGSYKFFSLITDLRLDISNPEILLFPPQPHETLLHTIVQKRSMYALAHLRPMIALNNQLECKPVKTIPPHFSHVYEASEEDVAHIFGKEDSTKKYFSIGTPLDMTTPVCIDLDAFTERSNGIFGKTGTGKTFLTRLILAGLVHSQKAVNLIFDMHSEYGLQARKEGSNSFVKGLKTLFSEKVAIFSLDPASTRRRGAAPDVTVTLTYQSLSVSDIISLQHELNLHPTACEAAYLLAAKFKKNWLEKLFAHKNELKELAETIGAHPESISALYRKLRALDRLPFFVPSHQSQNVTTDVIQQMMDFIDRGISVIVEFGNYTSTFCYLLIANIITRRLHDLYIKKTEQFLGSHNKADEPKKLMITIEEAHKFLNPQTARQTIFGTIAREMRKYYVSLLVVDQRPSGIDTEVLSQIGTKIVSQLNDDKDIGATLTGIANAQELRGVLATLETKKQALIMGHAITMPIVVKTREYDEKFYAALMPPPHTDKIVEQIF